MIQIQKRLPIAEAGVREAERILDESGVRAFCRACIAGNNSVSVWNGHGCCTGPRCENLGPVGCVQKPLSCALWLCGDARKVYPEAAKQLDKLHAESPTILRGPYGTGFRTMSLRVEESLVSIQGAK